MENLCCRKRLIWVALLGVFLIGCGEDDTPAAGTPTGTATLAPWKFAVTDDSRAAGGAAAKNNGVSTVVLAAIAEDIAAEGVDFVLFPGDLVTGDTNNSTLAGSEFDTWNATMAPVYKAGIPVYTTRGNHEYNPLFNGARNPKDPSKVPYLARFPMPANGPTDEVGLSYSFTWKNVKIVAFDQYAGRTDTYNDQLFAPDANKGQAMNSWVIDEIDASTAPVNFVMAHEMLFPSNSHPDCLANDPNSRDALVHALGTHNGTYFSGHDHMYLRGIATNDIGDRVAAIVVGTAGAGNYDYAAFDDVAHGYTGPGKYSVQASIGSSANPTFGYLLVTVDADNIWRAEFRGFQFTHWNDPTDVSLTPIAVMDSFASSTLH